MGAQLQGDFRSETGTLYTVTLDVEGFSGTPFDFDLREISITHKGETNDVHNPILASSARLTFSIPNGVVQGIFNGLTNAEEEKYRLRIDKDGAFHWAGFVIPDQVVIQDQPYPYDFSLEAVDGIGRLKEKDYTGDGTEWEDEATLLQHLYNVLSFIPAADFWAAADTYLRTHNQLFTEGQVAGVATSPLLTTRFNHRVMRQVDKAGKIKYKSAYEVLTEICKATASRFYFSDGTYYLEQVNRYASDDTDVTIKRFAKDQTPQADEVLDAWDARLLTIDRSALRLNGNADLTMLSGGIETYLSAARKAVVTYDHFKTRSVLSHISPVPTWTQAAHPDINTGEVTDNDGASRMLISADVSFNLDFADQLDLVPGRMKMRCNIKIEGSTTYYLNRTANITFGGEVVYGDAIWQINGGWVEFYTDYHNGSGNDFLYRFLLYTPNFPTSGDLTLGFDFIEFADLTGLELDAAEYSSEWTVSNVYGEVFSDGSVDAQSQGTEFATNNVNADNSDTLELSTLLGDGPTGNSFGRLQYNDGSDWIDADGWRVFPNTEYLPHGARIAEEILAPRVTPTQRMEAALIGGFLPHQLAERNGERFIFMQGTISLRTGIMDGAWCYITSVASGSTVPVDPQDTVIIPIGTPPGPYVPPTPAPGWQGQTAGSGAGRVTIDTGVIFVTNGIIAAGDTINFMIVDEREVIHPFVAGDEIELINPFTGGSQTLTVDTTQESDKTIPVVDTVAEHNYPHRSIIAHGPNWMTQMINKARRITKTFQLMPGYLDVPSTSSLMPLEFDPFFRVPEWMNGYKVARATIHFRQAGSANGNININVELGNQADTISCNFANLQTTKIYSTYPTLSTGDLVVFKATNVSLADTYAKGLIATLEIIATP